ncbi:EAL domain-containing protein [Geodermatophilus sp. YIM 151500]|uniref:putative bifunctional diguanylate cyclase/phosphodiesterase n=1 Tax=Geodermatophilus sp. YIM 151500 TaxID=2984531 RepID=UPI0021E364E6|nr:GGDEF domain-containing phosphodiesterase [Geodermatophilus sp. YIM 151500]MCV2490651.1 EAL domain-containing protein [Geodermatophilus sp. YIM 151500]
MTSAPLRRSGAPAAAPRPGRGARLAVPAGAVLVVAGGLAALAARLPTAAGPALVGALGLALALACWRERRVAADLRRTRTHFRSVLKGSPDPVVILDDRARVSYVSRRAARMLGRDQAALVGLPVQCAVHPDDLPTLRAAAAAPATRDESAVRTVRVRHADGRWLLVQATVRDLRADPEAGTLVLYCRDVTARPPLPGLDGDLLELSLADPVTGLPNRAALVRRLAAVQRVAGHPTALVLVGIEGLGALPEDDADAALRALASRLARSLRGEDWLARGKDGDFVVLVYGTVADAEVVAARLVADVGPLVTATGTVPLTAVAGVTALSPGVDTGEALRRGDRALRSARAAGPGAVHRYDDALRSAEDRRATLRADLAGALARGELRLVFQPVVDAVLQRTVSVEALLRWRHPELGEVPPAEFVPLAEESPLIADLGRWVLREACAAVAALPDDDPAGTGPAVAVNVSARHVRSGELVPDVLAALERSGLPPSRLVVEITESVLLDDAHVVDDLAALRTLGVRIAVDDFGTGWSSLAYLAGLPVDVLKMDQHFLAGVESDPQRRALCRAVLHLGASLGLPVVVEGVTTPAELALLRDMGHRYLQGYVFSRPFEADQLAAGAWRACLPAGALR